MPVYIDSIKFQDEYSGTISGGADTGVPYLMGAVGDLAYATIVCRVAWNALNVTCTFSSSKKTITLNYCGSTLAGSGLTITDNSFTGLGFQVGDTIVVSGTTSGVDDATYTIKSLTDTVITVNEVIPQDGVFAGINIYGATTVNALDFYYNLVPPANNLRRQPLPNPFNSRTSGSFISLTDQNSIQKFTGFKTPYVDTFSMSPNATSKAWWIKSIGAIQGVPLVTDHGVDGSYNHNYTIVFPFLITPFFLSNQLQIFQNALAQGDLTSLNGNNFGVPDYFINGCLGFICQIDARFNIGSQNADHSSANITTFQNGNTSWFNTFFPSGVKQGSNLLVDAQYDLIDCTYTDNSNNPLTSIDVNNPTNVKLKISGGISFTDIPYVLNFMWLPINAGEYQGYSQKNQADFREVFLHDRCKTQQGAGSVNGDKFGTATQAITGLTSTVYNYGQDLELDFTIDLGSLSKSTFNADTQRNYLIWVTPQDASVTSLSSSNRNAVIGDVNQAFVNTDDPTLLKIITRTTTDVHFYNYPDTDGSRFFTNWNSWSGEYGLARCDFEVKPNCIIKKVNVIIEAQVYDGDGNTVATFPLESWTNQTESFFDGELNQISINDNRDFDLPDGDLRNTRSINRKGTTVNPDGSWPFTIVYGFQLGYRFWQSLQNVAEQYSRYPVNYWAVFTQTFAGANSSNPVIPTGYTSGIKFKIIWDIENISTGITTQFISESNIGSYDEGSQIGTNEYTIYTTDLLGTDLNQVISTDTPMYILVQFDGDSIAPPDRHVAFGELVLYYNDGLEIVYDRIMTNDDGPETTKSLWQTVPILSYNASNNTAVLMAKLDLTSDPLKLRSAGIYAKIIYKEV